MTRETGMATKADLARRKRFENPKCKNCWDKGFSTEMIGGYRIAPDFENDVEYKSGASVVKNYCKCAKGKRLKKQANNGSNNSKIRGEKGR